MGSIHLYNFLAFVAVLSAIVILALAGKATDLAIMTGLVGVLGSFKPWGAQSPPHEGPTGAAGDPTSVVVDNPPENPVHTAQAEPLVGSPKAETPEDGA